MATFQQLYACFAVSHHHSHLRTAGDKIVLPPSALQTFLSAAPALGVPLLLRLRNPATDKLSHCGVADFTAGEGTALLPNWVMADMGLSDGQVAEVELAPLPPQPTAGDPNAALEATLRAFSCLSVGEERAKLIPFTGVGRRLKEATRSDAVSVSGRGKRKGWRIFEIGGSDDDLKKRKTETPECSTPVVRNDGVWVSGINRKSGKLVFGGSNQLLKKKKNDDECDKTVKEEEKGFKPFTGRTYRLSNC